MLPKRETLSCLCLLAGSLPAPLLAQTAADGLAWEANVRARFEHVDDDAFADNGRATTARLRLGLRYRFDDHWSVLLEGAGVVATGDHDDGTNARRDLPAIIDPPGAGWNQWLVAWKGEPGSATLGRQRVVFANQRWVGNSGWRQNEQTFDAASFEYVPAKDLRMRYAWFDRVHRVNGDDARDPLARERDLNTHVVELAWTRGNAQWAADALLHEDRDVATASTATLGLRLSATAVHDSRGPSIEVEAAHQRDHANNPLRFSHAYWRIEPAYARRGITYRIGWEHLGGNGRHALQTPLATLHAFNGWADKFAASTPPGGLDDLYAGVAGKTVCEGCEWALTWHDYGADAAIPADHYGSEWNASFAFPLHKGFKGLVKFADYRADDYARDTAKVWLQLEWQR